MARLKNPSAGRLNSTLLEKLRSFPRTDAGNAEAFELLHGSRLRYVHSKCEPTFGRTRPQRVFQEARDNTRSRPCGPAEKDGNPKAFFRQLWDQPR